MSRGDRAARARLGARRLRAIALVALISSATACFADGPDPAPQRELCQFGAGAKPRQTLGPTEPHGRFLPIDHFVVVMQENRSFDHYFQMLPERGQPDVEVAPADFANPDPLHAGESIRIYHKTALCEANPRHGWNPAHEQYAGGRMNGFVAANGPKAHNAMGYYDESELGYYYALAQKFAIADHYFCDVLGPTFPNRMFAEAGTSLGMTGDGQPPTRAERQSIFHQLESAGLSWAIYAEGQTFEEQMFPSLHAEQGPHFLPLQRFLDDAAAGKLPALAWVEARYAPDGSSADEHPPGDVQLGQQFASVVVDAVMHAPEWLHTALFLTYDEHGGYFDHVPPPSACRPDASRPELQPSDARGNFDRLGMRVPMIAIAPFAKPHYVSHQVYSHASLLRMIEARFELPAFSGRDANATPLYDLFDFDDPVFGVPPELPAAAVDVVQLEQCLAKYPPDAANQRATGGS